MANIELFCDGVTLYPGNPDTNIMPEVFWRICNDVNAENPDISPEGLLRTVIGRLGDMATRQQQPELIA